MAENTFLGLQPYAEDDAYRFKGRTEESQELFRLIGRSDFTVCYAESGEGKTSLLNAGVFPLLRENMYFPIAITFTNDDYQVTPDSFDTIIDRCIKDSIAEYNEKNKGVNVEYRLSSSDFQGLDRQTELQQELSRYSWWKLRNYKPQAMGLTFMPVFVFDQFEEVFSLPGSAVWTKSFFDWLEEVAADSCPDHIIEKVRSIIGSEATFPAIREEKGFKAVFSLRKEYIGELDYWGMQTHFIPALKDNRYCLKALTYEGAKKVMAQQARFDEAKVEQVLTWFVGEYSSEPERTIAEGLPVIPALLLSVVCDSWEKDIDTFASLGSDTIGQSLSKILERFYLQAIDAVVADQVRLFPDLSPKQCRHDIETTLFALVDANRKRIRTKTTTASLTQVDFDTKYKKVLSDNRIIKVTKIEGEDYVEIVHDSLCPVIAAKKEARMVQEAKAREEQRVREQTRKMRKRMILFGVIAAIVIGLMAIFLWQNSRYQMTHESLNLSMRQRDSIQDLMTLVDQQKGKLQEDSALLANHLSHILSDSLLLADKNDSLQQQIIENQKKDKTIERLEALSRMNIEHNVAGKLSERISPDLKDYATNLSISGELNGTDFALLREMIIEGSLRHLDLEKVQIVSGGGVYLSKGSWNYTTKENVIGDYVFYECSRLQSIKLPKLMTSIGSNAFDGCSGLTSIYIPNSVRFIGREVFRSCSGLMSVTIPKSLTSISDCTFQGCSSLTSVTIPKSVRSIGSAAFNGCSSLTSVTIPNSVTTIGDDAFKGCSSLTSVTIPNSVKRIGNYIFRGCTSLTSVTIPDSVTSIGSYAFSGCSGLTSVTIPDSVTTIGGYAFSGCSSLKSIDIPNSVSRIDRGAFSACSGLTSITIPNSVTSIAYNTFSRCSGLKSFTIPDSVTSIGEGAFQDCSGLTSITIPNSVTSIGRAAFSGTGIFANSLDGLFYVDKWVCGYKGISPEGILTLKSDTRGISCFAFSGCSSLTNVTIPDSVTIIGEGAFSNCSGLTSITITKSMTSIGDYAFYRCSGLTSITIHKTNIEELTVGNNAFNNTGECKWIVPVGPTGDEDKYVKKYKEQPWWGNWEIRHE